MEAYLKRCIHLGIIMHSMCAVELYGPYDIYAMVNYEIPSPPLPTVVGGRCVVNISVTKYVSRLPSGIRLRSIKTKTACVVEQEEKQKQSDSREQQIRFYENNPDLCPSVLFQNKLHQIALQRVRDTKKSN